MKANYQIHESLYAIKKEKGVFSWDKGRDYKNDELEMVGFLNECKIQLNGKILELGCGAGDLSACLCQYGKVTGVDISKTAIELAKTKSPEAKFYEANVLNMFLKSSEKFDFIIDGHLLHCIVGNDRKIIFDKVKNLLNKDGVFIVRSMIGDVLDEKVLQNYNYKTNCIEQNNVSLRYIPSLQCLINELKQNNFEIVNYKILPREDRNSQDEFLAILKGE